jgi:hypothetical protein
LARVVLVRLVALLGYRGQQDRTLCFHRLHQTAVAAARANLVRRGLD